jgi:dihydrolipoamide dehydrogenase
MEKLVDVAVIGAGTAGINALTEIRKVTEDFVLINSGPLGTTCARVGCMPSKIMIQVGDDYHRRQVFGDEGIGGADSLAIDIAQAMTHVRALRDAFVGGIIEDVIEPLGDRFIDGQAEFVEPTVLRVGALTLHAGRVVIATGSRPVIPRRWDDLEGYLLTTDTIFEQKNLPAQMAVMGLGAIGLELGQAFKRMGLAVTGVDQLEFIGGLQDPEVNRAAVEIFKKEMPLFLAAQADIERAGQGLRITAGDREFLTDKALLSIGRAPNTDRLHLERLGVELDRRGVPVYDRHTLQVGHLPVFIAGDAADYRPILHEVAHEGTVAGYNAVHDPVVGFKRKTPLVICFSDPNICRAGSAWNDVKDSDPAIGAAHFHGGREKIMLRTHGLIRIYAERSTGRLLGTEMVAPDGEHLAHLMAWSIAQNLTAFDLLARPFYHPTITETLKAALEDLVDDIDGDRPALPGFEPLGLR